MTKVALLVALLAVFPATAARLYAAEGGPNLSSLYEMDLTDGSLTAIGPIGHAVLGLAVDPNTAVLYGVTPLSDPSPSRLLTIEVDTGEGHVIGDPLFALVLESAADLTFTSDGALYGWLEDFSDSLISIDETNGHGIGVGDSGLATHGSGLAASPQDVLYLAPEGDTGSLYTIDRVTGLPTSSVALTGSISSDEIVALAFHPATGVLYGIARLLAGGVLITIDPASGHIEPLGSFAESLDAIAFGPLCGDGEVDAPWETCDDGNTAGGDECPATCTTVPEPDAFSFSAAAVLALLALGRRRSRG